QFIHAGVGENLAAASAPKYIDCESGRVALIAVTSTFHNSWIAGEQRPDVEGRPGVNPLRYSSKFIVTKEQMDQLKEVAASTYINADYNLAVKEGFEVHSNDDFKFDSYNFVVSATPGMTTTPYEMDMKRVIRSIKEAKRQADYVVVSVHCHEMEGEDK